MKIKRYLIAILVIAGFIPVALFAYEPRFAGSSVKYNIEDPANAVGYYARLPGKSARYVINFKESGKLSASLRIPDIPSAGKNVAMQIGYRDLNGDQQKVDLVFSEDEWRYYKDEFTGNGYYLGPEFMADVSSGTHAITISSLPDNEKPYVLIIGNEEDESWQSSYRTFIELAKIKNQVYSEMPLTAYMNIYGIVLAVPVLLLAVLIIYGIVRTYLNFKKMDEQTDKDDDIVVSDHKD